MRTNLKDFDYYLSYKSKLEFLEKQNTELLNDGKILQERIPTVKDLLRQNALKTTILKYTFGESIEDVKKEFGKVINYANENWVGLWLLQLKPDQKLYQYTLSGYDEMLCMLSLGYLLDIVKADFEKLVNLIDKDGVKDFLLEFIIRAKLKNRTLITNENYQTRFDIPKVFKKLREAIIETDKIEAEKLTKEFIKQDWYKNHKGQGWYDSHKSKYDIYYGYWSFEAAAIVKIMGLDDSSFRNCDYYPKDLL